MPKIVFDSLPIDSVRRYDDNGFLHVETANLTKEQVAPYRGDEIPNFERLGFKADEIYHGYRPARELATRETVQSLNGIPIHLKHHVDSADAPAKDSRIGSTGTDAVFDAPYLKNSLHFTDGDAIRRIQDGSMKELSLGYMYTPVREDGEFNGEHYDFIMTDIRANHLALVERGRAGPDVVVGDEQLQNLPSEKMGEVNQPSKTGETKMDREQEIKKLLDDAVNAGLDPEKVKAQIENILAATVTEDEDEGEQKEPETDVQKDECGEGETAKDEDDKTACDDMPSDDEIAKLVEELGEGATLADAIKKGFEVGNKFGWEDGVKYGEEQEKKEPEKLDEEHESEGMKRALGEDSIARLEKMFEEKRQADKDALNAKFNAIEECRATLGNVKFTAFDDAGQIYIAALKKEGFNTKGINSAEARTAYRAYMSAKGVSKKMAMDEKKTEIKSDIMSNLFNNVRVGE